MAISPSHGLLDPTLQGIHVPYQFVYADATARGAATGFIATDVGKLARQSDDNSLWLLSATTPTWVAVGGGGGGGGGTVTLTNDCGFDVAAGDHVYVDESNASSFIDNSGDPLGVTLMPGIVEDTAIVSGAAGLVRFFGIAPVSNLDGAASIGDKIAQSTTSLKGTPHTATGFSEGDYGIALDTGTTPPVFLWGSVPVQRNERVLARATGINLNTGTPPTLYTVPASRTAIITRIVVRNASTSLTTVSFSIGYNSTPFDDVLANATHTELTGNTLFTALVPKIGAAIGAAASVLKLKNNTLQGGAATATFDIIGYLF